MKISTVFCFTLLACTVLTAQEKVAEGQYQSSPTAAQAGTRHWELTTAPSGGFTLRSEIAQPKEGIRVVQVANLNEQLVPTSNGYELYVKDQKTPVAILECKFVSGKITCEGKSEKGQAPPSKPYAYKGSFLLVVNELTRFDLAWLMAGAINSANLTSGKTALRTIRVGGGAALELTDDLNIAALQAAVGADKVKALRPQDYTGWEFVTDEKETLSFAGTEDIDLSGTKVRARHYTVKSGDETLNLWVAGPGLILKTTVGDGVEILLKEFRQYRKLIPEVKVEASPSN